MLDKLANFVYYTCCSLIRTISSAGMSIRLTCEGHRFESCIVHQQKALKRKVSLFFCLSDVVYLLDGEVIIW